MAQHIRDLEYRGHEVVVIKEHGYYSCDVREDTFDGAFIAGFWGLQTESIAVDKAYDWIDAYEGARK